MLAGIGVPPPPPPVQQEVESMQTVGETQSVLELTPQAPQIPVTVLDCFSVPQAKALSDYIHNRCVVVTHNRGVGGWEPPPPSMFKVGELAIGESTGLVTP